MGRVAEYTSVFTLKNLIFTTSSRRGPTVLIDIGGNIGLSSLSIVNEFNIRVIAIEAEDKNTRLVERKLQTLAGKIFRC